MRKKVNKNLLNCQKNEKHKTETSNQTEHKDLAPHPHIQ